MNYTPVIDIQTGENKKRIILTACDNLRQAAELRENYIKNYLQHCHIFNPNSRRAYNG